MIGDMEEGEINKKELLMDLQELKKLFREAEENSDPTSARIVG